MEDLRLGVNFPRVTKRAATLRTFLASPVETCGQTQTRQENLNQWHEEAKNS